MDLRVAGSPQTCMTYQITTLLHGGRLVQLADHMVRIRTGRYELSYYTAAELFVITLRTVSQIPYSALLHRVGERGETDRVSTQPPRYYRVLGF